MVSNSLWKSSAVDVRTRSCLSASKTQTSYNIALQKQAWDIRMLPSRVGCTGTTAVGHRTDLVSRPRARAATGGVLLLLLRRRRRRGQTAAVSLDGAAQDHWSIRHAAVNSVSRRHSIIDQSSTVRVGGRKITCFIINIINLSCFFCFRLS